MSGLGFIPEDLTAAANLFRVHGEDLQESAKGLTNLGDFSDGFSTVLGAVSRAAEISNGLASGNHSIGNHLQDSVNIYNSQEESNANSFNNAASSTGGGVKPVAKYSESGVSNLVNATNHFDNTSGDSEFSIQNILDSNINVLNTVSEKLGNHVNSLDNFHQGSSKARGNATNSWRGDAATSFDTHVDKHLKKVSNHINESEQFGSRVKNSYYTLNNHKMNVTNLVSEIKNVSPGKVSLNTKTGDITYQGSGDEATDIQVKKVLKEYNTRLNTAVNGFNNEASSLKSMAVKAFRHPVSGRKVNSVKVNPKVEEAAAKTVKPNRNRSSVDKLDKYYRGEYRKALNKARLNAQKRPNAVTSITFLGQKIPISNIQLQDALGFVNTKHLLVNDKGYVNLLPGMGIQPLGSFYMPTNQQKYDRLNSFHKTLNFPNAKLMYFNSDSENDGQAIVSIGNPDTAKRVGVFVPGAGVNIEHSQDEMNQLRMFLEKSNPGVSKAGILYMGYDNPAGILEAANPTAAINGAQNLHDFVNGRPRAQGASWNIIGHSYGGEVVARAAQFGNPLKVDNAILLGNPGLPIDNYDSFQNHLQSHNGSNGHVYVDTLPGDGAGAMGFVHSGLRLSAIPLPFTGSIDGVESLGRADNHRLPGLPDMNDPNSYIPAFTGELGRGEDPKVVFDPAARHTQYFNDSVYAAKIGNKLFGKNN